MEKRSQDTLKKRVQRFDVSLESIQKNLNTDYDDNVVLLFVFFYQAHYHKIIEMTVGVKKKITKERFTTFFASAERSGSAQIYQQIRQVSHDPLFSDCMNAFGGVVALLNNHRQVISVNTCFLEFVGFNEPSAMLGLRPGEILKCVQAKDAPNGCGTGRLCKDCGAAIAIVSSQASDQAVTRECLMTTQTDSDEKSFEFRVRACPITLDDVKYTLLTMQDIRKEKKFEVMERLFIHDIANLITALYGNVHLIQKASPNSQVRILNEIDILVGILSEEVNAQRDILSMESGTLQVESQQTEVSTIFSELEKQFSATNIYRTKGIHFDRSTDEICFFVSQPLLHRVLENMLKNALDAIPDHSFVRLYCEEDENTVRFHVWNQGAIPERVAPHIFQRYFSTKEGVGHGLGTYSMKLIGEKYLKGRVSFTSTKEEGTRFSLCLPKSSRDP